MWEITFKVHFPPLAYAVFSAWFVEKTFLPLNYLDTLDKSQLAIYAWFYVDSSIPFHALIYPEDNATLPSLLTFPVNFVMKLCKLSLFFQKCLIILSPFHFHINFNIRLSVSTNSVLWFWFTFCWMHRSIWKEFIL